jgi:L-threonylcarbamoyladenylate synthase
MSRRVQLSQAGIAAAAADAARVIGGGGVIVYPTETLYGIGADALSAGAVRRVAEVKRRPDTKPIPVIVQDADALRRLAASVPPAAHLLMEAFWPGPLTIVFPALDGLPPPLAAGSGAIGVRIPSSPFCLELLRAAGVPLTSTSANPSGAEPPRTVAAILEALGDGVELSVDAGELPPSLPSTVVSVTGPRPRLLRAGAVPARRIAAVVDLDLELPA